MWQDEPAGSAAPGGAGLGPGLGPRVSPRNGKKALRGAARARTKTNVQQPVTIRSVTEGIVTSLLQTARLGGVIEVMPPEAARRVADPNPSKR